MVQPAAELYIFSVEEMLPVQGPSMRMEQVPPQQAVLAGEMEVVVVVVAVLYSFIHKDKP